MAATGHAILCNPEEIIYSFPDMFNVGLPIAAQLQLRRDNLKCDCGLY